MLSRSFFYFLPNRYAYNVSKFLYLTIFLLFNTSLAKAFKCLVLIRLGHLLYPLP
jgi:hypothetical protein